MEKVKTHTLATWALPRVRDRKLYAAYRRGIVPADMVTRWDHMVWPERFREVGVLHTWERDQEIPLPEKMDLSAPKAFLIYFNSLIGWTSPKAYIPGADRPALEGMTEKVPRAEWTSYAAFCCRVRTHIARLVENFGTSPLSFECQRVKGILMVVSPMTAEYISPELPLVRELAWRVGYQVDGWKRLAAPETATEAPPCFHCTPERQCEVFFALTIGFSPRQLP